MWNDTIKSLFHGCEKCTRSEGGSFSSPKSSIIWNRMIFEKKKKKLKGYSNFISMTEINMNMNNYRYPWKSISWYMCHFEISKVTMLKLLVFYNLLMGIVLLLLLEELVMTLADEWKCLMKWKPKEWLEYNQMVYENFPFTINKK